MFNKEEKTNPKDAETIIGPSIKIKGNFHGDGNMIIEGSIEGSVKTTNVLLIGNKANVMANIEAKQARIGGKINGNIKVSNYLEITNTAKINGDIEAGEISIEKGAVMNGKITMVKESHQHQQQHQYHGHHDRK